MEKRNRDGFPLEECSRCLGGGRYSYCRSHGTTCFRCHGSGVVIAKRARAAWDAFCAARKAQREPLCRDLQPGDVVLMAQTRRTVEHVELRPEENWGHYWDKDRQKIVVRGVVVRYADGTVDHTSENTLVRRAGDVDPAPFLATISDAKRTRKHAGGAA